VKETIGRPDPETVVQEDDILVVYGYNKDIETYCLGQEEHQIRS
jgi:trk system potassium uptake protein TrkA